MADKDLAGKVAVVTGASRKIGIGAAIARELARAGADVFITFYQPYDAEMPWGSQTSEVEELLSELWSFDVRADGMELDLTRPNAAHLLFEGAFGAFGRVDILVNNAAYSVDVDIEGLTPELIDNHHAVNVRGMMLLCAEFARRWQRRDGGRIINLSSGQGLHPMPDNLAYAASKGAVEAFTVSLSAALAPRGITVNAIDPGATDTGWMPPGLKADLIAHAPLQRIGTPEDAARLVRWLASEDARWITGQIMHSRGGM